jgi:hypothetical protein
VEEDDLNERSKSVEKASERLIQRARPFKGSSIGVGLEHIAKIPIGGELIQDILAALNSGDSSELKWGLWFAQGVLSSKPPQEFLRYLVTMVPKWIQHEDFDVRCRTLGLLIPLRDNFLDYRSIMLKCLTDSNSEIRSRALGEFRTFLTRDDIPTLLPFQNDDYMSEASMGSPLIYPIRNQALAVIEELSQQTFSKHENVTALADGLTVYWWDWKSFLEWWQRGRPKP